MSLLNIHLKIHKYKKKQNPIRCIIFKTKVVLTRLPNSNIKKEKQKKNYIKKNIKINR